MGTTEHAQKNRQDYKNLLYLKFLAKCWCEHAQLAVFAFAESARTWKTAVAPVKVKAAN